MFTFLNVKYLKSVSESESLKACAYTALSKGYERNLLMENEEDDYNPNICTDMNRDANNQCEKHWGHHQIQLSTHATCHV